MVTGRSDLVRHTARLGALAKLIDYDQTPVTRLRYSESDLLQIDHESTLKL